MRSIVVSASAVAVLAAQDGPRPRNIIIFVADGLRHGSVNAADTPAFNRVRTQGVYFANSHSVFPSHTMPNAAAIATGHYPGDTGQFANQIFTAYPLFDSGNFGQARGTMVPDVEDPLVLGDMNARFGGNYLREASLVALARSYGYSTAVVGKIGPAASQDLSELDTTRSGTLRPPMTIVLDGATGTARGVPLRESTVALLAAAGMKPVPPPRSQPGDHQTPGTNAANVEHQQWFADAATRAILPAFARSPEPFVLVFWSGDPDFTQHAQGDSLNALKPGINGATSRAAVQNADRNLRQILDYLDAHPEVRDNTNVFVTADHGFSTVSRREVDASGQVTRSYSASRRYLDESGRQEVNEGHLPPGFLAIDLAHHLALPLYDPELQTTAVDGSKRYMPVEPASGRAGRDVRQRLTTEAALIGGSGRIARPTDARVVVAQTSIYVPGNDRDLIDRIVRFLSEQDYVGGIFVHDRFGQMPGALRMSDVGLVGTATTPKPAIVINFKSFPLDPGRPDMTGVIVGGVRQHGQGDHGSLARANTFINMAAMGPDFKRRFASHAPAGNPDIATTLAHLMKRKMPNLGKLRGRVLTEALAGGPTTVRSSRAVKRSRPSENGLATVLMYQVADGRLYLDEACFTRNETCP